MYRRAPGDPDKAYTLVKLGESSFRLPAGWKGRTNESPARVRAYDETMDDFREALRRQLQASGGRSDHVRSEIVAPPPRGGTVPHGDVIALLDAFLHVGLTDVVFEGAPTPLTSRERAERRAR